MGVERTWARRAGREQLRRAHTLTVAHESLCAVRVIDLGATLQTVDIARSQSHALNTGSRRPCGTNRTRGTDGSDRPDCPGRSGKTLETLETLGSRGPGRSHRTGRPCGSGRAGGAGWANDVREARDATSGWAGVVGDPKPENRGDHGNRESGREEEPHRPSDETASHLFDPFYVLDRPFPPQPRRAVGKPRPSKRCRTSR
jgi:hypothetical protein